jgi:hypothetical protein
MLKKSLLLFLVSLSVFLAAEGQLTLVLQTPPVGVMQKVQLWNMALINTSSNAVGVSVQLTLIDVRNGQAVMTGVSRPVFANRGTTAVTAKDIYPVQYTYLSPLFTDRDPNGFLPVGNYKACYTVGLLGGGHHASILAEECVPVEVQPLSPPQLISPTDTATVGTAYLQFSWIPPAPINLFSNLTYDMILVEVQPGQGANDAIQKNIPFYNISHYKDQVYLYPASNRPLDTGRVYAWRIIAKNEDQFIDQSEVWTFKLASPKPMTQAPDLSNFIPLRQSNEPAAGIHQLTTDTLGIKYYSFERDHDAIVNFYDARGQMVRSNSQHIVYGDNFLVFLLDGHFTKGDIYRVELIDGHNIKHTAGFSLKTSK